MQLRSATGPEAMEASEGRHTEDERMSARLARGLGQAWL